MVLAESWISKEWLQSAHGSPRKNLPSYAPTQSVEEGFDGPAGDSKCRFATRPIESMWAGTANGPVTSAHEAAVPQLVRDSEQDGSRCKSNTVTTSLQRPPQPTLSVSTEWDGGHQPRVNDSNFLNLYWKKDQPAWLAEHERCIKYASFEGKALSECVCEWVERKKSSARRPRRHTVDSSTFPPDVQEPGFPDRQDKTSPAWSTGDIVLDRAFNRWSSGVFDSDSVSTSDSSTSKSGKHTQVSVYESSNVLPAFQLPLPSIITQPASHLSGFPHLEAFIPFSREHLSTSYSEWRFEHRGQTNSPRIDLE
ncbi:hypothetical protein T439DRAFT_330570 [Meredithblackwellia eburnea MCA 4105]